MVEVGEGDKLGETPRFILDIPQNSKVVIKNAKMPLFKKPQTASNNVRVLMVCEI